MSTCPKCGYINTEGSYYCQNCGTELHKVSQAPSPVINRASNANPQTTPPDYNLNKHTKEYVGSNPIVEKRVESIKDPADEKDKIKQESLKDISNPDNYPLKWHKWMIYVVLWLWAIINVANFVALANMKQPLLGIPFLGVAVFEIYTRFQLARFKKGAYEKLLVCCGINCAIALLSVVMSGGSTSATNNGASVAIGIAWLFINWRYYSSRKALFVN